MDIKALLKLSMEKAASDIHLSCDRPAMIRVDGELVALNDNPLNNDDMQHILQSLLNDEQLNRYRQQLEYDGSYSTDDIAARFRLNAYYDRQGPALALRVIPEDIPSFEQLGLNSNFEILCRQPNGIILITGPTGSGKSTTLAAMINYINQHKRQHIIAIEDPIEFFYPYQSSLINQRQIGQDSKSFQAALRSALREDPDVILVGEMRDIETINLALTAAETGHLVLSTLHTNSASKAIHRILDVFPAGEKEMIRAMLSESLRAVIAQRLFKKKDGGRVAAREIMISTPAIANMIRENKIPQIYSAIQTGQSYGMMTIEQSIELLQKNSVIE